MIKALKVLYFACLIGAVGLLIVNTYGIITDKLDGRMSTVMTMVIIALAYGMISSKRSIRSREKEQEMLAKRKARQQKEEDE